ncbi:3-hydroxyisobutyryl-coenzyme A hydrolase [Abortiporus biennis]|nr:3-hydroxyisobutyryl-coenzyme A hydrolase [Abortiporus biennis]
MFARRLGRMSRKTLSATQRTQAISRHMMSSSASKSAPLDLNADEAPVLFESVGQIRKYILNRPKKLNALDEPMINILRPQVEAWSKSELNKVLVGTGVGRAFCAGGDVASVVSNAVNAETRPKAIDFFKREFELDYLLAAIPLPYIVIMDGITMGGGVGLSSHAAFRIATENTVYAMPETKIGYTPDVGGSHFLSRLDGQIGTYLGLTGDILKGRAVFQHGLATHYVPSRRIPALLERIASLDKPTYPIIDSLIEEASTEPQADDSLSPFVGDLRVALDSAFRHDTVEEIVQDLQKLSETTKDESIRSWANQTLEALELRSPTSLKVALHAVRLGKTMNLLETLQMEMNFATAFCSGETPDFNTGVTAVLVEKIKERPQWYPSTLKEVKYSDIKRRFFEKYSPAKGNSPALDVPEELVNIKIIHPMRYSLPTEEEIGKMVDGSHPASGGTVITRDELIKKFEQLRKGKLGLHEKLQDVLARKCVEDVDKETGDKWLRWVH